MAAINGDAADDVVGVFPTGDGLQRFAVHNFEVFHLKPGDGIEGADNVVVGLADGVLLGKIQTAEEGLRDADGRFALLGGKQRVARTEGQTAFFANDGAGANFNVALQIVHHGADDGDLLEVLFSEISAMRANHVEQFADHLADTVEVARTARSFHDAVDGRVGECASVGFGIHLCGGRRKYEIHFHVFKQSTIGFKGAWIIFQILGVVELGGIDKNADHGDVVFLHAAFHQ